MSQTTITIQTIDQHNKLVLYPENPTVERGDNVIWVIDRNSGVQQVNSIGEDDGSHNIFKPLPSENKSGQWSGYIDKTIKHDKTESYFIEFRREADPKTYRSAHHQITVKVDN